MARSTKNRPHPPRSPGRGDSRAAGGRERSNQTARNIRETVESIVIAFVLAFLFRTFEAEAFVIPTGSMAPTLQGMHKDVQCPQCGFRYQASASVEAADEMQRMRLELRRVEGELDQLDATGDQTGGMRAARLRAEAGQLRRLAVGRKVVSATCPMCGYTMSVGDQPTYNGDRILVNKFIYDISDPQRWDVVVFKFPGDAKMNYIKRLVGLPGETVRIYQGDLFTRSAADAPFQIARKSPAETLATLQEVDDSRYQPKFLAAHNWPLRWQIWPAAAAGQPGAWIAQTRTEGKVDGAQIFSIDGTAPATQWIRYRHLVPSAAQWARMRDGPLTPAEVARIRPQLITDFYAYNTWTTRDQGQTLSPPKRGLHWVGDLMVDCNVQIKQSRGQLLLDLVEAGKHFRCTFDLASGNATLAIDGVDQFKPRAATRVRAPGRYRLAFANVNDQLLLWVNGTNVAFAAATTYDADQVFGDRARMRPRATAQHPGDLAPAGVGAKDAALAITDLKIFRDVYYIADKSGAAGRPITDYDPDGPPIARLSSRGLAEFLSEPRQWDAFVHRRHVEFPLTANQFFVLGDNSPFSKDGRLWPLEGFGHYVERQLLIGRAMFVYWPHSWNRLPGTSIPVPFFPNFADMRLVR